VAVRTISDANSDDDLVAEARKHLTKPQMSDLDAEALMKRVMVSDPEAFLAFARYSHAAMQILHPDGETDDPEPATELPKSTVADEPDESAPVDAADAL
jgi:hypothetical protein